MALVPEARRAVGVDEVTLDSRPVRQKQAHTALPKLQPRGIDRPGTGRDTHSPTTFIRDLGAAFRALEARLRRSVDVVDAGLEAGQRRLVVGVEEQQAGDVLLAGGELDRVPVVLGLGRLIDGTTRLDSLVERLRPAARGRGDSRGGLLEARRKLSSLGVWSLR
jgi:hypothetical protein